MARKRTYRGEAPKYGTISLYPEYWELVEWHATPSPLRKPPTQQLFAKAHSMHETTITRWKLCPEFDRDVREAIRRELKRDLPDVLYSLKSRIFKDGSAAEVKLFLQWADQWMETSKVEHTTTATADLPPAMKSLVAEFEQKLKDQLTKPKL